MNTLELPLLWGRCFLVSVRDAVLQLTLDFVEDRPEGVNKINATIIELYIHEYTPDPFRLSS
jgi:hypothetical protein